MIKYNSNKRKNKWVEKYNKWRCHQRLHERSLNELMSMKMMSESYVMAFAGFQLNTKIYGIFYEQKTKRNSIHPFSKLSVKVGVTT